jgi:tetratricopeptide (TPR) repeat protein
MKIDFRKGAKNSQSGRVTAFGILILIMFLITIYELGVIYADWNRIRMIGLNIRVLNEQRLPVSDVSFSINGDFAGFTNMEGKFKALISEPGDIEITARKNPFDDIDTTIALKEEGSDLILTMNRPFATLTVVTMSETGEPLKDVGVFVQSKNQGSTGEDGSITISKSLHIHDTVDVKFSKSGFDELSENIYLSDVNHIDSFALVKRAVPSRPAVAAPPKPKPDFQSYVNRASNYLDRAISGESRYFGKALTEIEKALRAKPRSLLAKQLKVEILYNFAKSLRDSNLPYEAVNRLGEALKMYGDLPQDPLYDQVVKLKMEIEKELGG